MYGIADPHITPVTDGIDVAEGEGPIVDCYRSLRRGESVLREVELGSIIARVAGLVGQIEQGIYANLISWCFQRRHQPPTIIPPLELYRGFLRAFYAYPGD